MSQQQTSRSRGPRSPEVTGFYEPDTGSVQYVVSDPASKRAAIIDAVWNFDPRSARTDTRSADEIVAHVRERGLTVEWILDTHPHADHFMAAAYLKRKLNAPQAIGAKVREIAGLWRGIYHLAQAFDVDADFDRLFADGDSFKIGGLSVRVMLSPGHTLGSVTYIVGEDAAFVHDTLMAPDFRLLARGFSRRRRLNALPLDPGDPGAASADAPVRRPRLLQGRPRPAMGSERRRAQGQEHPRQERHERSAIRQAADRARQDAAAARPHALRAAGQFAWRPAARAGERRAQLFQDSGEQVLICRVIPGRREAPGPESKAKSVCVAPGLRVRGLRPRPGMTGCSYFAGKIMQVVVAWA